MNVTELARILKITPKELFEYLPQLGFDIGQKAIKINRDVANRIIKEWPVLKRKIEAQKRAAHMAGEITDKTTSVRKNIEIPAFITIREFAALAGLPVNAILSQLMKSGVFVSLNEKIDFETAWLVGSELNIEITQKTETEAVETREDEKLKEIMSHQAEDSLVARPPVIVVMGHVDHGKTKLLDAIRKANVMEGEAGGITQHIGAYQVVRKDKLITFIDTPGHEAFTAMRSRGAKVADIAILVVAADDGVKPQTVEAFRIIESVGIPFVVAINKIDKPEANIDKTKQELSSQLNIIPEDWGGKVICVPVSAREGTGISDLLDMVLLTAEADTNSIKANPAAQAVGTIVESRLDKGSGPVATILIQNGTMRIGDQLMFNGINMGKVRNLYNYLGKTIDEAGPSTPARLIGFKTQPQVGDVIEVGIGEKMDSRRMKDVSRPASSAFSDMQADDATIKKINLVIKADVLGSAEAIEESLEKICTPEVKIKIIHKGLGNLTEGDIKRAEAANAIIAGFNVKVPTVIEELAREKNIEIKLYNVIYHLINDIKAKIEGLTQPVIRRTSLGRLKVLAVFRTEKDSQIIGGKVLDGVIESHALFDIKRQEEIIASGKIARLQAGKQDVGQAETGQECGMQTENKTAIAKGDILEIYKDEIVSTNKN